MPGIPMGIPADIPANIPANIPVGIPIGIPVDIPANIPVDISMAVPVTDGAQQVCRPSSNKTASSRTASYRVISNWALSNRTSNRPINKAKKKSTNRVAKIKSHPDFDLEPLLWAFAGLEGESEGRWQRTRSESDSKSRPVTVTGSTRSKRAESDSKFSEANSWGQIGRNSISSFECAGINIQDAKAASQRVSLSGSEQAFSSTHPVQQQTQAIAVGKVISRNLLYTESTSNHSNRSSWSPTQTPIQTGWTRSNAGFQFTAIVRTKNSLFWY